MRALSRGVTVAVMLLLAGCSTQTTDPVFDNPLDPNGGAPIPAPEEVTLVVGSNSVQISWSAPTGAEVDQYAVFRRWVDDPQGGDTKLLTKTGGTSYTDAGARNGRTYSYEVAAGSNGRFGDRSDPVEVTPGLFTMVLAGDSPRTSSRSVTAVLGAPLGTAGVQLSEDSSFPGAAWRPYAPTTTWTLSPGDGEKTVYARFRLADGSLSVPVSDTVILDTRAVITSVSFDGGTVRSPGETVHFRLDAGEPDGAATVDVSGLFTGLPLFDDGSHGDAAAGDGIYERAVEIPGGTSVTSAAVRGRFTDAAGNVAASVDAQRTLTVREAPEGVTLLDLIPSAPSEPARVVVRWTQSLAPDFASYRVFRDTTAQIDDSSPQLTVINSRTTVDYLDLEAAEGKTYWYRIYVRNGAGLETGSNALSITLDNVRPPAPVTLNQPDGTAPDRIALSWSRNLDGDFAAYRVYRNETGAVDPGDVLVADIGDSRRVYWDDAGLTENTEYYYRVYTVDTGGNTARSNEVSARTANLPPPAVTLNAATAVVDTAATLSWTASDAHDFARYRLYRSLSPSVSTASTLVADLAEQDAVSYRDTGLDANTRYYYRVFVEDDGPDAKTTGSNVVEVLTP